MASSSKRKVTIVVDLAYVTPKSGVTTSIDTVAAKKDAKKVVKAIVNNQLVIVKGNDKFNVAGQPLSKKYISLYLIFEEECFHVGHSSSCF
jgi:hypothetical protein